MPPEEAGDSAEGTDAGDVADHDDVEETVGRSASGVIRIPPPKQRPLAITTCCTRRREVSPSMVRSTSRFRKVISALIDTPRKMAVPSSPPRFCGLRFTRATTSPPRPQSATLTKRRWVPSAKSLRQ